MALRVRLAKITWLILGYYLLGRLSLLLAIPPGYATAIWPAAGVALAGLLSFGYRAWPAILIASFCINFPTALVVSDATTFWQSAVLALALGSGATLQALAGAFLIRRLLVYPIAFANEVEIGKFLALGAPIACLVSATIGLTSLWLAGSVTDANLIFSWFTWWVGDTIGVLVVMPIFLVWTALPESLTRREKVFISAPIGLLLLLVSGMFVQASALERDRTQVELGRRADSVAHALAARLSSYSEVLRTVGNFVEASPVPVDRRAFADFTAGPLQRYPGLQALSWNARVTDRDRADYEAAIQGEGFPSFQIGELDPHGRMRRAGRRASYLPITFIVPGAQNAAALGFDVASEPSRRIAMSRALLSGAPIASSPVDLVQGEGEGSGTVILLPVHRKQALGAHAESPAPQGYVAAVFQVEKMMDSFLRDEDTHGMRLQLYDASSADPGRMLYPVRPASDGRHTSADAAAPPATAIRSMTIEVAGRPWHLLFLPPVAPDNERPWLAWGVLIAGILFTALSSVFLLVAVGRRVAVQNDVRLRTAELQASNQALDESREQARAIIDTAFDAYVAIDTNSTIVEWNRQAEQTFGWRREEVLGQNMARLIIPDRYRPAHFHGIAHFLQTGDGPVLSRRVELFAVHRDGHEFPVELTVWPTGVGDSYRFHAFLHDIGQRQRAVRRLAAQTAAAAALLESSDLASAARKLLESICNALDWTVGGLWVPDADTVSLQLAELWHRQDARLAGFAKISRVMTFKPGVGLPGRIWSTGQPSWVPDVTRDHNFPRARHAAAAGLHGAFGFPVFNGESVVAILEFFSASIEEPDPELLAMMKTVGNLIGQYVARHQTESVLEQKEEFLTAVLENITEGIVACDANGSLTLFNRATRELHGLSALPLPAEQWSEHYDLFLPDGITPLPTEHIPLLRALKGEQIRDLEMVIAPKDGARRMVVCNGRALLDRKGEKLGAVVAMHDITGRKETEHSLQQLAHFDPLTGLPNRRLFHETLRSAMAQADAQRWLVFLLFLDLDNFKDINDSLGHAAGDELLRQVGQRLLGCLRVRDTVGRLGGDEFGVILLVPGDPLVAVRVAEKVHSALRIPFELEGQTVNTTVSIGITVYPTDTADVHSLVRYADMSMYEAKQAGRNTHRFYTEAMNLRAREKLELESALRRALAEDEFVLYYQPKMSLTTGRWTGVEALIRWNRPGVGLVQPAEFISVLEDTGLIVPVGAWVVATACRQIARWQEAGFGPLPIAVNVSALQVQRKSLSTALTGPGAATGVEGDANELWSATAACLRQHLVQPGQLEFELTESAVMADAEHSVELLRRLKELGIHVSVDDFGTGYSSLAYLRRFPLDSVKIDGAFIRDVMTNAEDASITLAIIGMAHSLKLQVVAECVETSEQLEFLRANGCDQVQGYFIARPMPVEELERRWREKN